MRGEEKGSSGREDYLAGDAGASATLKLVGGEGRRWREAPVERGVAQGLLLRGVLLLLLLRGHGKRGAGRERSGGGVAATGGINGAMSRGGSTDGAASRGRSREGRPPASERIGEW
jgi:hypothetical protein